MTDFKPQVLTQLNRWTSRFAEGCIHFLQINYRLHSSAWAAGWGPHGFANEPLPSLEALTLPLLLVRQTLPASDRLFLTIKDAYTQCAPDTEHARSVRQSYSSFCTKLHDPPFG